MKFDDIKQSWQSEIQATDNQTDFSAAIESVEKKVAKFDRHLLWRDGREIAVGLLIMPIFGYWLFTKAEHWITIVGLVIILLGLITYPVMVYRARKLPGKKLHSIRTFLESEKLKVANQVKLLESLFWWHIGPLGIGIFMSVIGSNIERNGMLIWEQGLINYIIGCCVLFAVLTFGNKWWARKKYQPIINELDARLDQLDSFNVIEGGKSEH
jgi:hypothetical protein